MEDIFSKKNIKPMLLSESNEPFDSKDFIYELKLDGIRSIIYIDKNYVEIRNKRNMRLNQIYPELKDIWKQVGERCILDGELIAIKDGKPDFYNLQKRSMMTNKTKIDFAQQMNPVSFSAFDILYIGSEQVTDKPLHERKSILRDILKENDRIIVSRYIHEKGSEMFNLTVELNLEGIVAKRIDSKYFFDKTSKDWIKIKNLKDEDFVICGYIIKPGNKVSIVLGAYKGEALVRQGHVTMGVSQQDLKKIMSIETVQKPHFNNPSDIDAIWVEPILVCTVKFMMRSNEGGLRQPVFKGIRNDKTPEQCIVKDIE